MVESKNRMQQDFTKRIVIVVKEGLEQWQVLNAVAHVAAQLANKMKEPFDTGESFDTKDGVKHPRNSQFPIVTLKANAGDMSAFAKAVRELGLPHLGFFREMIETTDDSEIVKILAGKTEEELEYLAIGVFGSNEVVKPLTKKFSLYK